MDNIGLHIRGFKCFKDNIFTLNKMTLLTGANASGKSSVIQAILLLKAASESEETMSLLSLEDSRYAFDFGTPDSLINNDSAEDEVTISMNKGLAIGFNGGKQESGRRLFVEVNKLSELKSVFANGFVYFCAERQGPRYEYLRRFSADFGCGCHGENTGNVVSDNWNTRIAGNRMRKSVDDYALFNIALDEWVDYVFPGISVRIQQVGSQNYQVIIRDKQHNVQTDSTNIGFGISYALPIIVGALLSKEGSWLVIENPEAHIHAKAQSNMGYFLGMMAAAGLRVIIETHSEHVVNGIRRSAILSGRLNPEDINIYFFRGKSESKLINIDSQGNLSDFPIDFFDQSRQDMMGIIKKVRG